MKNKRGFTLIELLIVLSIVSLLSSIIFSTINNARTKARDAKRQMDIDAVRKALEMYYADNGAYPDSEGSWVSLEGDTNLQSDMEDYLSRIPQDPLCVSGNEYSYQYNSDGQSYEISAKNENTGYFYTQESGGIISQADNPSEPPPNSSPGISPFGIWDTITGFGIDTPDFDSMDDIGIKWEAVPVPPLLPGNWENWKSHYETYYKNSDVNPVPIIDIVSTREGGGGLANPNNFYNAVKDAVFNLSSINYWMLGVEMDNQYNVDAITPERYALYIRLAYKAVKDAGTNAKLITAGTSGSANTYAGSGFFVQVFEDLGELESIEKNPSSYDWQSSNDKYGITTEADFNLAFGADSHDKYMDGHHWSNFDFKYNANNYRTQTISLTNAIKNMLANYGYGDIILWDTQTGTYSGKPANCIIEPNPANCPNQTEKDQANDLVKKYVLSLTLGIDKIFWTTSYEFLWQNNSEHFFSKVGLIYNGAGNDDQGLGVKKLSYYTYKKMVEVLEGSDWNNIETVQESGGVYIYKFNKAGKNIWVAWNDNTDSQSISINVGTIDSAKTTEAIPNETYGKDVDYKSDFFVSDPISVNGDGDINVILSDVPLFIEEY